MNFLFAVAMAATSPTAFSNTEPTCVYDELESRAAAKASSKLADAVGPCRSRYQWTDEDVELALKVTRALVVLGKARAEAGKAGINLGEVDQRFETLTKEQVISFGWEGEPKPIPPIFGETIEPLRGKLSEKQFVKAGLVVLWSAVAQNAIEGLIKQRIKPN